MPAVKKSKKDDDLVATSCKNCSPDEDDGDYLVDDDDDVPPSDDLIVEELDDWYKPPDDVPPSDDSIVEEFGDWFEPSNDNVTLDNDEIVDVVDIVNNDDGLYDDGLYDDGPVAADDLTDDPVPCGCRDCISAVLERNANGFSCGARINYLMSEEGGNIPEVEACRVIAGDDYPTICGPACNPLLCDGRGTFCGCASCTSQVWETLAGAFSCGARVQYLMSSAGGGQSEANACAQIAQENAECRLCDPNTCA